MSLSATGPARLAAGLLLAICIGCQSAGDAAPAPARPGGERVGRTLRALLTQDPPSMSLIGKTDRYSEIVALQITDSLVQYDPRMVLQPRLARSWEFSEDRLTLTLHLRPGVRWHDGREVTAADVLFTVEQVRDPAVESRAFAPLFQDLVSLEALDPHTIRATYGAAATEALEAWRVPIVPAHRAERGVLLLTGEYARHPVGCGPFRFVRYRPGEEIVLEANEDYWDGRPGIDRLVFRIISDQMTGYQSLLAGELDIMVVTPDLWLDARDSDAAERLESLVYHRLSLWQVGFNQDGSNPFFGDVRVRRAMLLALDRRRFIDNVLHGLARPAATSYHPDSAWTDPAIRPVSYDPDRARALLDEAGWVDPDGDGVREKNGVPFEFTLTIFTSSQGINDQMAAWQQQSWSEIGVRARIEKLDWHTFRRRRSDHDFQAAMAGIGFTPNPDQYELYHSSASEGGYNYVSFTDTEVDRLVTRARLVSDEQQRRRVFFELQARLDALQPIAALLHFATPVLHDRRLQGIVPSPLDHWRTTHGPRNWRWVDEEG